MYKVRPTTQFNRSLKKFSKKNLVTRDELMDVVDVLARGDRLPSKNKNHKLSGKLKRIWECHIRGDVLLLHYIIHKAGELILYDLCTHDKLNRK